MKQKNSLKKIKKENLTVGVSGALNEKISAIYLKYHFYFLNFLGCLRAI